MLRTQQWAKQKPFLTSGNKAMHIRVFVRADHLSPATVVALLVFVTWHDLFFSQQSPKSPQLTSVVVEAANLNWSQRQDARWLCNCTLETAPLAWIRSKGWSTSPPCAERQRHHSLWLPNRYAAGNFLAETPWKMAVWRMKFPRAFRINSFHRFKPIYWEISLKYITHKK